jgi:hypothetical protein
MAESTHIRKFKYKFNSPGGTSQSVGIFASRIDDVGRSININHGSFFVETKVICAGTATTAHGTIVRRAQYSWALGTWAHQDEFIYHGAGNLNNVYYRIGSSPVASVTYLSTTANKIVANITFSTNIQYAQVFVDVIGLDY